MPHQCPFCWLLHVHLHLLLRAVVQYIIVTNHTSALLNNPLTFPIFIRVSCIIFVHYVHYFVDQIFHEAPLTQRLVLPFTGCKILVPSLHGYETIQRSRSHSNYNCQGGTECWYGTTEVCSTF
jgi:hypothetical protein